jgi:hypothetical protein
MYGPSIMSWDENSDRSGEEKAKMLGTGREVKKGKSGLQQQSLHDKRRSRMSRQRGPSNCDGRARQQGALGVSLWR